VTPRAGIADDEPLVNRQGIYRRIYARGIEVVTLSEPVLGDDFADGRLALRHVLTGAVRHVEEVALLTYATPRQPDDSLAAPLREAGVDVHLVGDCLAPRNVLAATGDGYRAGIGI
jgi:hypothetical protein